jgi:hypothetical protein
MSRILAAVLLAVGGLVVMAAPAAADYYCRTTGMSSETWTYCDGSYPDGTAWRTVTTCYPGTGSITHER